MVGESGASTSDPVTGHKTANRGADTSDVAGGAVTHRQLLGQLPLHRGTGLADSLAAGPLHYVPNEIGALSRAGDQRLLGLGEPAPLRSRADRRKRVAHDNRPGRAT